MYIQLTETGKEQHKIPHIKELREYTGMGLKEAKTFVEDLMEKEHLEVDDTFKSLNKGSFFVVSDTLTGVTKNDLRELVERAVWNNQNELAIMLIEAIDTIK